MIKGNGKRSRVLYMPNPQQGRKAEAPPAFPRFPQPYPYSIPASGHCTHRHYSTRATLAGCSPSAASATPAGGS